MLIGYARVSTADQKLDLQKDALRTAGCELVGTDTASGARAERPGLAEALKACRPGDTIVVWKLDRLGRSLPHMVETVRALVAQGVGFRSLQESIDTTTSGGKLVFHIFASLAEFERDLIRERTNAGLSAARARGRKGGRRVIRVPRLRTDDLTTFLPVGVRLQPGKFAQGYGVTVDAVLCGSHAYAAGLRAGDVIRAIGGKTLLTKTLDSDLKTLLPYAEANLGPSSTPLTVRHLGADGPETLTL